MVHKVASHGDLLLDLALRRPELEAEAKRACISLLPDWRRLQLSDVQVSEISGGITNLLWKVAPADGMGLEPVVLRVFGKQTDQIIDRANEQRILIHVNRAGFGAQVLATFENGRIEAFLRMRPLKPEEMVTRQMAGRIARRVRQLHAVDMQAPATPDLFPTIRQWLAKARQLDFSDEPEKAAAHAALDFDRFASEIAEVAAASEALGIRPAFAHNDLLAGNILVPEEEQPGQAAASGEVQLIDFEYGGCTSVAFDLGNHFNEYAGFECDYSRFPPEEHVSAFVRAYLAEGASQPLEERAVRQLVAECYCMALASHQYWGVWALLQAKFSPIDFDYVSYSRLRWREYFARKAEFLGQARKGPSWRQAEREESAA